MRPTSFRPFLSPVLPIFTVLVLAFCIPSIKAEDPWTDEADLDRLIQANSLHLFGKGKVTIQDGTVEILLNKDGHLASAFRGKNIMDSTHPKLAGAERRFIKDGDSILPGLAGVAFGKGIWESRFRLAGKINVSFDIRMPGLVNSQSKPRVRILNKKGTGWETTFFNTISRVAGGKSKGKMLTKDPKYRKPGPKWFPRTGESIPISFGFDDDGLRVLFKKKELVRTKKAKPKGGKVVIQFSKIVFTVQNLKITGDLDRDWCKKRLRQLLKSGDLVR